MMDFLKAYPGVTKDEYLWEWTVPQIKLASMDNTHVEHLTEEQARQEEIRRNSVTYDGVAALANDLGVKIF